MNSEIDVHEPVSFSEDSDDDSLFNEKPDLTSAPEYAEGLSSRSNVARRGVPPIPGLHFNPTTLLPADLALSILDHIKQANYFKGGRINQIMLFERGHDAPFEGERGTVDHDAVAQLATSRPDEELQSTLPPFLNELLSKLAVILQGRIPPETHQLLFPPPTNEPRAARQAILNLYHPGEGIKAHVDLLNRFGDGIIVVSFGSGIAMDFEKVTEEGQDREGVTCSSLWLEPRSVLVLEGDARYCWTHGIAARPGDWVEALSSEDVLEDEAKVEVPEAEWVLRGVRVSITLRWLLPGAEVVGGSRKDS